MKKSTFLLGAAVAALTVGSAAAADLAVKARMPAPVIAPVFSWTGCYVGLHAGGGAMRSDYTDSNSIDNNSFNNESSSGGTHRWGNGGLVGGQAGCNYQTGVLVMGVEGEGYWSGMKARSEFSANNLFGEGGSFNSFTETKNKYDFTIAGRIGVAYERAFIYGKAGWAWGAHDFAFGTTTVDFVGATPFSYREAGSATLNGPLFGLGVEYALTNNWTVKGEYNYINYGLSGVNFASADTNLNVAAWRNSQSAEKHIFKFGVNYLFNIGPTAVVARY